METRSILGLNLADDQLGIAWIIADRSPQVTGAQLRWFARIEAKRDTFGSVGRKGSRTKQRARLAFDESTADCSADHVAIADRNDLAHVIAAELGELGSAILSTGSIEAAAESVGMSRATAYRRIADVRRRFADYV